MWQAWVLVLSTLLLVGMVRRLRGRAIRYRALRRLATGETVRALHGVSLRVLVEGSTALAGMKRGRSNRTRGDLVVTQERVVLVCNRGTLLNRGRGDGGPPWEVRCTGPGRLVLEASLSDRHRKNARFRVEFSELDDADGWVTLLRTYAARPSSSRT